MSSKIKAEYRRIKQTVLSIFLMLWFVSITNSTAQAQDTAYIAILNQFHTVLQTANTSQSNGTAIIAGERSFVNLSLQAQQLWYYDNATQTIRLRANPGKCMARKGQQFVADPIILADVVPSSDPNSARQRWVLEERRFKLAADKTVCIGLLNPNYNNGNTAVLTEVSTLGMYQQWYLRKKPSGKLTADGQLHRVNSPGNTYVDLIIPDPCPYQYLNIKARGGDGGIRSVHNIITGKEDLKAKGGEGALVHGTYKIGTAPGELSPGTNLRFVVGRAGDSHRNDGGVVGASGGGGTGVLFELSGTTRPSGFSYYPWEILQVAGGGGGGYSDCCASREDGYPANNDTPVLLNNNAPVEEYNGWCEKDGEQRKVNFGAVSGPTPIPQPVAGTVTEQASN